MVIFQVTNQIQDLTVQANDLLLKLVCEFHCLYSYLNGYSKEELLGLGVTQIRKLDELISFLDLGLREIGEEVSLDRVQQFTAEEIV